MSEYDEREAKRRGASEGTKREQYDRYMKKWEDLWKRSQGDDVELKADEIEESGAIPKKEWEKYLINRINFEEMYEVESVMQIMEELAINADSEKALEIYDEISISLFELDDIKEDVLKYLPRIPDYLKTGKEKLKAKEEFERRADFKAHLERTDIKREGSDWLTNKDMTEYEKRENKRKSVNEGTPEEQLKTYEDRWLKLWKKSRGLDENDKSAEGVPGAIEQDNWGRYVRMRIKAGDTYEIEAVLQMMSEIVVNGDLHKALEIYDEISVSNSALDRVREAVIEHLPRIPEIFPDNQQKLNAKRTFEIRANSIARTERNLIRGRQQDRNKINMESAFKNSLTSNVILPQDASEARDVLTNPEISKEREN